MLHPLKTQLIIYLLSLLANTSLAQPHVVMSVSDGFARISTSEGYYRPIASGSRLYGDEIIYPEHLDVSISIWCDGNESQARRLQGKSSYSPPEYGCAIYNRNGERVRQGGTKAPFTLDAEAQAIFDAKHALILEDPYLNETQNIFALARLYEMYDAYEDNYDLLYPRLNDPSTSTEIRHSPYLNIVLAEALLRLGRYDTAHHYLQQSLTYLRYPCPLGDRILYNLDYIYQNSSIQAPPGGYDSNACYDAN